MISRPVLLERLTEKKILFITLFLAVHSCIHLEPVEYSELSIEKQRRKIFVTVVSSQLDEKQA